MSIRGNVREDVRLVEEELISRLVRFLLAMERGGDMRSD